MATSQFSIIKTNRPASDFFLPTSGGLRQYKDTEKPYPRKAALPEKLSTVREKSRFHPSKTWNNSRQDSCMRLQGLKALDGAGRTERETDLEAYLPMLRQIHREEAATKGQPLSLYSAPATPLAARFLVATYILTDNG